MKVHRTAKNDAISPLRSGVARLGRAVLWVIFGLILLIPKLNRLRRRRRAWNVVRVLIAVTGAGMLIIAVSRGSAVAPIVAAILMMLFALIVTPERPGFSIDARARELGALIVVDGGRYIHASANPERVKLFLAPDRLLVLNLALEVVAEISLQEIRALVVEPARADWSFRVERTGSTSKFVYKGTFGEHLARVAEATVRGQLHRELPVLR